MITHDPATVLAEMQARCEAATDGPWLSGDDGDGFTMVYRPVARTIAECMPSNPSRGNDATFIAHARTDEPLLIAALQAVLGVHRKTTATYDGGRIIQEVCAACNHASQFGVPGLWPCPTIRTITEALKETP